MDLTEGQALIEKLLQHVSRTKYRLTIPWEQEGDMILWDNTSVMHRATGGTYEGIHPRDMRRTTVKDMSSQRYGLNGEVDWRVGMP
jgi:alpha-ketoglutarate-dependent 2,4-dichlorophenoxyacetate dioxygenase